MKSKFVKTKQTFILKFIIGGTPGDGFCMLKFSYISSLYKRAMKNNSFNSCSYINVIFRLKGTA